MLFDIEMGVNWAKVISNIIVIRHCTNIMCVNISFYKNNKSVISVMAFQKLHVLELILKL